MRLSGRALPWVLFLLALSLRIAFIEQYRANPLFARPIIDARTYHEWALRIAGGQGFGEGAFTRAPGYPAFLSAIYAATSATPGAPAEGILAAKRVQALLGALSALFLYLAASRLFDRRVGAIAGALFALHPVLVFYTGELFGETLAVFLLLAGLLALVLGLSRGRLWFLASGLLLGSATVTRPTFLPLAAALPVILAATRRPASRGVRDGILLAAGLAVAIAPVTIRNAQKSGGFVPIAAQGGVNLWIGNNPMTDGKTALSPGRGRTATPEPDADIIDVASRQIAEQEVGRSLTAGEVSDYWGNKAKTWMREHPGAFARLLLRKVRYFWGGAEIWDQQCDVDFLARFSPLLGALLVDHPLSIPTGIVMPLAAVGIALALRDLRRSWLPLWFLAAYAAGALAFSITSRYRLPALPFLFLFAALAAVTLADRWRAGGARRALPLAIPIVLFAILLNLHARHPNPLLQSRGRVFIANAFIEAGQPESATPILEEAMRLDPAAADPWYALGMARHASGDRGGAGRAFEEALARDPSFERARVNLGNVLAEDGRWEEAVDQYERALELLPGDGLVIENLLGVAREASAKGAPLVAERALRRVLAERPDDPGALNALAWNLAERLGRPVEAVPLAARAAALRPDAAEIEDTLGWSLGLSGDWSAALPHLRAASAALGDNPDVALHYGVALRLAGRSTVPEHEASLAPALLKAAFAAPGGDSRRARAAELLGNF